MNIKIKTDHLLKGLSLIIKNTNVIFFRVLFQKLLMDLFKLLMNFLKAFWLSLSCTWIFYNLNLFRILSPIYYFVKSLQFFSFSLLSLSSFLFIKVRLSYCNHFHFVFFILLYPWLLLLNFVTNIWLLFIINR